MNIMTNKLFILEGVDSSGKTFLSNQLIEKFNAKYIHLSYSKDIDEYMDTYHLLKWLQALEENIKHNVILDRSIISAIIYQQAYRESILNRPEILSLAKKIFNTISKSKNIIPILCHLDFEDWKSNFLKGVQNNKDEMYSFDSKLIEVYNSYDMLYHNNSLCGIHLNFKFNNHNYINNPFKYDNL